jgi:hypothetical protein
VEDHAGIGHQRVDVAGLLDGLGNAAGIGDVECQSLVDVEIVECPRIPRRRHHAVPASREFGCRGPANTS